MMNPSDYISGVGAILTGTGLIYAGRQLKLARKIAKAQFLLQIDGLFKDHDSIAKDLRGKWRAEGGPETLEEWLAVERYMGLFERIQVMIEDGVVDLKTFDQLFGYRIFYIVENNVIREHKLVERKDQWTRFIKLWDSLIGLKRDRQLYPPNLDEKQKNFIASTRNVVEKTQP